ncbi:MAG: SUMF1/EgtB/PvdO family nonheme iron enzyme [Anaerolineae bacterium]|nr:SUMF1/EgtB/PvdO family nonheme iron enzyme [Anaerolineae bacterium]
MTEKRHALIIASYQYQDPDLRQLVAPAQDAEALARVLQDPAIGGFQVQTLQNECSYKVNQAIEAFFADRKTDDLLLLYYSGHGIKDEDGRLYFATTDTRRKMLRTTAIPTTLVNDVMRYSRSRRQVLLLDCCYSGAFAKGMIAKAGAGIGTKEHFKGRGRVVLTASDAIQYAFEEDKVIGEGSHSVFTRHLIQGLKTGEADMDDNGWVSLDELYDYVYDRVTGEAPQQTPGKWVFDLQGEIRIARNPHWVVKPAELPPELQRAIESPFAGLREGAVGELERLLHSSDESLSLAARQSLVHLTDDDSHRVSTTAGRALRTVITPPADKPPSALPTPVIQEQKVPPTRRPTPAATPQAQGQLRRLLSSVPAWVWAVVGVAAVGLLIILGNLAGWGATTAPTQEPMPTIEPILETRSADDMVMVYVPGGTFQMGSDESDSDAANHEFPQHPVTLDGFWIDQTEVTNAQYALCVADGGCDESSCASNDDYNGDDHPVVGVSWQNADAYCKWAGGRLPTEAEWEYTARGEEGYIYPWGNDAPTCERAQFGDCSGRAVPVGSLPDGASWCGALDMAGNVWEWTANWYGDYPSGAQTNPTGPTDGNFKVLRGGGWSIDWGNVRAANRGSAAPLYRDPGIGFRCGGVAPGQ